MKPHALRVITALSSLVLAAAGHSATLDYKANLSGALEAPSSPGTGTAEVIIDTSAQTMEVKVQFSGLVGTTTASHIHAPTSAPFTGNANVATTTPFFPGFPIGVQSGTYDHTFDLTLASSYNPAFVTANGGTPTSAEAALLAALNAGEAYLNIHSTQFPAGEIRGFLVLVPEATSTASLLGLAMLVLIGLAGLTQHQRPVRVTAVSLPRQ